MALDHSSWGSSRYNPNLLVSVSWISTCLIFHTLSKQLYIEFLALWIIDLNNFGMSEIVMSGGVFSLMQRRNIRQDMPLVLSFPNFQGLSAFNLFQEDLQGDLSTPCHIQNLLKLYAVMYIFFASVLSLQFGCELSMEGIEFSSMVRKVGMEIPKPWPLFLIGQHKEGVIFCNLCHFSGPRGGLFLTCTKHPT